MPFLSPPRLYFKGGFVTNVDTANNNDASAFNYVDCTNVAMRLDAISPGMTAANFRDWCKGLFQPDLENPMPAGWNPLGDNACWFENVTVTGCDVGSGLVSDPAVEPLIGARVQIGKAAHRNTALMVDVDPEGVLGTQLFSDQIRIDKGLTPRVSGQPATAFSYWLHFGRNLGMTRFAKASAVWHFEVPLDALTINAEQSPFLSQVQALLGQRKSLIVRFATYLVQTKRTVPELAQRFAAGHNDENPATGVALGSISLSDSEEVGSAPCGRPMFATSTFITDHMNWSLGPASASVDVQRDKIVLDLLSTFPENGSSAPKMHVGPAYLAYVDDQGSAVRVGTFDYGDKIFNECAGIVEVDIPPGMLDAVLSHPLEIHLEKYGRAGARERIVRVETPARGIYLEPGETASIPLRLTRFGRSPNAPTDIQIAHYETSDGTFNEADPARPLVTHPDKVTTDANGLVTLTIQAKRPGVGLVRFLEPGEDPTIPPLEYVGRFTRYDFCNIRVLPRDDYSSLPDSEIIWDLIYKEVFEYYYCLYPTMDRFIRLNDEAAVRASGPSILARMHPNLHERWEYMPRTRELSSGKRTLFERWLNLA